MATSKQKVAAAFHEVASNPPAILAKTRKKSGAAQARKQAVAISLSKARAAGAKIPMATGGSPRMTETELAQGYRNHGKC